MKKKNVQSTIKTVAIALFMGILTLPTLSWWVLSLLNIANPRIMETLDFDLGENRNKAAFPSSFHADSFPGEFEAYFNDRVPYRSLIISNNNKFNQRLEGTYTEKIQPLLVSAFYGDMEQSPSGTLSSVSDLESLLGGGANSSPQDSADAPAPDEDDENAPQHSYEEYQREDATCTQNGSIIYMCSECKETYTEILTAPGHNLTPVQTIEPDYDNYGYTLCRCETCNHEGRYDFTEKLVDTSYLPPTIMNEYTVMGRRNWLFYAGNGSVGYYRGTNLINEETLADYTTRVSTLQKLCDERGIQLQLMIVPNKEQVYAEYMPSYTIENDPKRVPRLVEHIEAETGVTILYPLEELQAGKLYWQVYYKYDTHWNHAGSFIGAQALYKALGIPTTAVADTKYDTTLRSGGDLVSLGALDVANYQNDPVYTLTYKPDVTVLSSTGNREGTGIVRTESDSTNTCNFVMVGDSFRNGMIPYIEKDFSNCTFTHRDHLGNQQVIDAVKESDVLVVMAAERYDNRLMNSINTLIEILSEESVSSN